MRFLSTPGGVPGGRPGSWTRDRGRPAADDPAEPVGPVLDLATRLLGPPPAERQSRPPAAERTPAWSDTWLGMAEVPGQQPGHAAGSAAGPPGGETATAYEVLARREPVALAAAERGARPGSPSAAPTARARAGLSGSRALGAVLALGAALALVVLVLQRPGTTEVGGALPSAVDAAGASAATDASRPPAEGPLVVAVVGEVANPGVVEVPPGSRIADAVAAAGGPTPRADLASVNLAAPVADGAQVVVLAQGVAPVGPAEGAGGGGGTGGATGAQGKVRLNTATVADLDALPGVGPVLAQRIVDWRTEHGPFRAVEQLREVTGIGEARFQDLRDRVVL